MQKQSPFYVALLATSFLVTGCAGPMSGTDSDMQAVLDAQGSLHPKPIETLSAREARLQPSPADGVKLVMQKQGKDPGDSQGIMTRDLMIPGAKGSIAARIYTPEISGGAPLPVVVYYHGGGWVIADLDTYDATPRAIARLTGAIVVSADYRHAPENKFPAAHEDAFAAWQWTVQNAASLGGDPARIAVMGESAGGNLAINVSIMARDRGAQMPVYEVLVYPVAGTSVNTPSYQENANAKPLNAAMMGWFMKQVIRSDADKDSPKLDLIGHANVEGLPPTTIITAQIDPLRSDGKMLAAKLAKAGVPVHAYNYEGVTHEFFGMGAVVAKAASAEMQASNDLNAAFRQ